MSRTYTIQEIIDEMESAEEYADLYSAASKISDPHFREEVESYIDDRESDEEDVETALSMLITDLLTDRLKLNESEEPEDMEIEPEEKEDMELVKTSMEEALAKCGELTEEVKTNIMTAHNKLDILIADEEEAIAGYKTYLEEVKEIIPEELYKELEVQLNEIIADEEEHITKLNVIKDAIKVSEEVLEESFAETEVERLRKSIDSATSVDEIHDVVEGELVVDQELIYKLQEFLFTTDAFEYAEGEALVNIYKTNLNNIIDDYIEECSE